MTLAEWLVTVEKTLTEVGRWQWIMGNSLIVQATRLKGPATTTTTAVKNNPAETHTSHPFNPFFWSPLNRRAVVIMCYWPDRDWDGKYEIRVCRVMSTSNLWISWNLPVTCIVVFIATDSIITCASDPPKEGSNWIHRVDGLWGAPAVRCLMKP